MALHDADGFAASDGLLLWRTCGAALVADFGIASDATALHYPTALV